MSTTVFENAFYFGNFISSIFYGLELAIYGVIMHRILRKGSRSPARSRNFCMIYSTVMVMLSTINVVANAVWGEQMWITHRNDPGGVPEFIAKEVTVWYETLASTSVVCCVFMGDGLLIFRLFLVYGKSYAILVLPVLAYLATIGLGMLQVIISGMPNGNFFGRESAKVATAFYVITVSLNIILTILICIRLLRVSNRVSGALGEESAKVYTSAIAILVESAALYSASGIMYLVPFALNLPIDDFFGQLWTKMSVICPLLIILRVVKGRAWKADIVSRTPLSFARSVGIGSATLADGRTDISLEIKSSTYIR